ncbi:MULTISPECIES: sugar kinase [Sphingobacterium]|uniref:PfkB family carbohydrate kinase n=1 Tax=Sphingobacterium populi TaxID=1812824 RepID=A0ABW5UBZ2_9SPHI|nr:sugar kinase [Sphingobacterium sp. CFCC 11742]
MKKVLCFGEILLRLQAVGNSFFEKDNNQLQVFPGGSEANVASGLSQMGTPTAYCSAFPDHLLSQEIQEQLQGLGIDTSKSLRFGDRIGTYILLSANGLSKGEVIYDRRYSSFSQLTLEDIDFDQLFEDIDWFHWTALSPALNENVAELIEPILKEAKKRNIIISVDLNYRNKLWQYGKDPIEIMPDLVAHCDVVMGNIWAANKMLGTSVDDQLDRQTSSATYFEAAKQSASEIFALFPSVKHVANTFRFMDNPQHNLFYGTYHTRTENVVSTIYETNEVVDRIGSGDAFMAGFIHGLKSQSPAQQVVDIATGAGYHKLFVSGDLGNGKY